MPDSELTTLASTGSLQDPNVVSTQVARLLGDDRSRAFADNFAGQWLQTRLMNNVAPDYALFPNYSEELGQAMAAETQLFFEKFLYAGLPVRELLTAPFGFVNSTLAEHYGLPEVVGGDMVEVALGAVPRRGLLTQGSFLTLTSHIDKTSPVRRGKWVLEQLLCAAPPPPPPGVETGIDESATEGLTLRQTLEVHRADPSCAGCHVVMDAIGLGLENYDAVGAYRTEDSGSTIDPSGEIPGAGTFVGALEMADLLAADPRVERCVAQQLMTYALGRQVQGADDARHLDQIVETMRSGGSTLTAAIGAIATSSPFLARGVGGVQ